MPANNFNLYLQDARNNFGAVRPAPICTDDEQSKGGFPNIPVSTNCYYGYHDLKSSRNNRVDTDYEMADVAAIHKSGTPTKINSKKRCAEEQYYPQSKRLREEVQKERNIEPETTETMKLDSNTEDLTEILYWNIHGGNLFHLIQ